MMDIHSVTYAYADCEKEVERMRLCIHMHAHEVMVTQQFITSLGRPEFPGTYASIGFHYLMLQGLIIQFHLSKEESFRAAEPVIEWLLSRGWKATGTSEDADSGNREYTFGKVTTDPPLFWPAHHEWKPYKLRATLRVWPHADSLVCQKVQVGTKPAYKFECREV